MAQREHFLTWGLLCVCLLLAGINVVPRLHTQKPLPVAEQSDIMVSVSGAVRNPGVYTLPWGARVTDLIAMADGFSSYADQTGVSLAAQLDSGDSVFVPTVRTTSGDERISLNSASLEELDSLPGIGPSTAEKIMRGRPYGRIEDLLDVSGIGEKTLEKLRPLVKL